jgi:cytoskeletal protein CcmA (bactofilin family)
MLVLPVMLLGVALATPSLQAAAQGDTNRDRVAVDQDLVIDKGDTVAGDVSVTNGDLTVYGTVDGKVSVVNGDVDIYGKVLGDVAVITGGGVTLNPGSSVGGNVLAPQDIKLEGNSTVGGNVTSLGGHIKKDDAAMVRGRSTEMANPVQALRDFVQPNKANSGSSGSIGDSPFNRIAALFSVGILSVLILLLSVGITAVVPNRVRTASATLQAEPGPSIVVGIITAFLIFPVAGLVAGVLTISVVGIILLPVLAVALLGAFLLGLVVVSHWLGEHFHDTIRTGGAGPLSMQMPTILIEVLLGVAVILASTLIPLLFLPSWMWVLMLLLVYSISCVGIGAAILSRLGTLAPPKQRRPTRLIYPTATHNHYGSTLPHNPPAQVEMAATTSPELTNTRPLGPTPVLPREE